MGGYSISSYRAAVCEMAGYDIGSPAYRLAKLKVETMQATMLANDETRHWMEMEIIDELDQMNNAAFAGSDPEVQHLLWMLDEAGYNDEADEVREWDWLEGEEEEA